MSLFQSSSSPQAGCKLGGLAVPRPLPDVSILIQPEDRMQVLEGHQHVARKHVSILIQPEDRMQVLEGHQHVARKHVSILIQPEDRMQVLEGHQHVARKHVSILIQPEDRMQGEAIDYEVQELVGFQSSSSPKTGCKVSLGFLGTTSRVFQSSSSPKTGCKLARVGRVSGIGKVSILIQPEDRMQAGQGRQGQRYRESFNPHPARRPDASGRCRGRSGQGKEVSILIHVNFHGL